MSSLQPEASKIRKFPCPGCGAKLEFNPDVAQLKCPYCGREEVILQEPAQVQERSYEEYFNANRTQLAALSTTALEVACSDCGANISFEPPDVAGDCPFCAAHIVAQPKSADPTLSPEGILPFGVGRKEARGQVQKWISSRWFAPNALKQLAQQEKIEGVYLPFWTYDCHTSSRYRGERGTYYYVSERYTDTDSNGNRVTKTRQVRKTRWRSVSGRVRRFFDDVLVAATTSVESNRLEALEPWNHESALEPYNQSFLAGFKVQRYQIPLKEGFVIKLGFRKFFSIRGGADINSSKYFVGSKHGFGGILTDIFCYRRNYFRVLKPWLEPCYGNLSCINFSQEVHKFL